MIITLHMSSYGGRGVWGDDDEEEATESKVWEREESGGGSGAGDEGLREGEK